MASKEVTRNDLRRALVFNAASKPLNVVVPAAVAVAGIVLELPLLLVLAVIVYGVLSALTFFDGEEAERVGKELYGSDDRRLESPRADIAKFSPEIARHVRAARTEDEHIRAAVADAELPFEEVSTETERLMTAMEQMARRAQRVQTYLEGQDTPRLERRIAELRASGGDQALIDALTEQVAVQGRLRQQLQRFDGAMEHLTTSLGTIHGQLVAMSVAGEDAAQTRLAAEVRDLREQVDAVGDGMREVYAEAAE